MDQIKQIILYDVLNNSSLPEELRYSKMASIRISFFVGGIIDVYSQWIQGKLDCTLDEISSDIAKLIVKSADEILASDW